MKIIEQKELNIKIQLGGKKEFNSPLALLQKNIYDHLSTKYLNYYIDEINIDLKFIAHCKLKRNWDMWTAPTNSPP